jgi:putative transposase
MSREVVILKGHVSRDHVHLLVSAPPNLSASKLAQYIKGKSSCRLQQEYPSLPKRYWGQHLWARGYFCASSGTVTDEMIKAYIEHQALPPDDGFSVADEASL